MSPQNQHYPTQKKELLERALSIEEREYRPDHVQVARTLTNLANAFGTPLGYVTLTGQHGQRQDTMIAMLNNISRKINCVRKIVSFSHF